VNNNPLRFTDPTGHRQCEDVDGTCLSEKQVTQKYKHQLQNKKDKDKKRSRDTGTSIQSNNPSIGEPQNLGNYLSAIWMGGGQPNSYYVGGAHFEDEGVTLTGAGLNYGATYGVEFFENGAVIHISENYSLSENTIHTEVDAAGAVLNVKTSDGIAHQVVLGELAVGDETKRTTTINVFGSYPAEMNITLFINLSETFVTTAPLPNFEFFTQPSAVYP